MTDAFFDSGFNLKKPIEGVSSGFNDDIYELYDDGMYLQTTGDQESQPSRISENRNFESLHQEIAHTMPKSSTRRPVPPIPVKPSRTKQPTADERDSSHSTYTKVNRPTAVATARPPIPGKPILPRQVSHELNEKLSQRTKSGDFGIHKTNISDTNPGSNTDFENSFIEEPFVEPDYHLFEVLFDFDADEYCENQNLYDSGSILAG